MVKRLFKALAPLVDYIVRYPFRILIFCIATAAVGFLLTINLKIENDLSRLVPKSYPSVQALNTLREQVGAENELVVAIESPSFEANKKFAEKLIPQALSLINPATSESWFIRAEYRKEIDFLEKNALYFATHNELDLLEEYLTIRLEEAKKEANPFYFELEEDETETDSLRDEITQMYDELIGSEYLISSDSLTMAVRFFPSGAQTDLEFIQKAYREMQRLTDEMNPSSFHPDMKITLAGRFLRTLIEVETITEDVKDSFGIGVLMLLGVVVLYFLYKSYRISAGAHLNFLTLIQEIARIPSIVLIVGLPLMLSLCWTFGIAYLLIGNLNIMTSTLGLVLFGMGIDFGIHFFARYSEERGSGNTTADAMKTTFMTTGQAVTVVGITTSAAFFVLTIADFKGFSEFGFIAGIGILLAIVAYIVFLPALLIFFERFKLLNLNSGLTNEKKSQIPAPGSNASGGNILIGVILAASIGVTVYSVSNFPEIKFEYDFGKLEPDYPRYEILDRKIQKVYNDKRARNAAYIITDTRKDAERVAEVLRHRARIDTLTPTIDRVEVFQDRFPVNARMAENKLARISYIRELLDDPFLQGQDNQHIMRLKQAASTTNRIPLYKVPAFIKSPFSSKSGEVGTLVIIYPSVSIADGRNSMNFADDVGLVSVGNNKNYYAGSTSIVASDMLRLMIEEAPVMVLLTVLIIIIFKLLILQRVKWTVLALLPLVVSFVWMFGLMCPLGWQLNFYNLVVLPTILGIGDDSGIHMVHRYREEGKGSISKVLGSTGEHITISALTTMLGFGGLLFSFHPGMASLGKLAVLGILLVLLAALFLLPAILKFIENAENRRSLKYHLKKK